MSFVNSASSTAMHFSEQQQMIQESARGFCQDQSSIEQVRALLNDTQGYKDQVWTDICELGWAGICIPEANGGSGLGLEALIPIAEAMGRNLLATPFITTNIAAQILIRAGSSTQRENCLGRLAGGSIATLALLDNEDWGGSHTELSLHNGQLNGRKWLVDYASNAELFLVSCSHNGQPSIALVEASQLGNGAIQAHTLIDETKRAALVDFSGVTVAEENLIANAGEVIAEAKLIAALLTSAEAVGAASSCLDLTIEYLKTRKQFGKLIGSYQALKHPAVDILNQIDGAKSQVYHAASLLEDSAGKIDKDIEIACRMSKACANDALLFAGDRAVQFHGGMGFTYECDAQLYIRRAQWSQQQYGDSAHQRKRLAPLLLPL